MIGKLKVPKTGYHFYAIIRIGCLVLGILFIAGALYQISGVSINQDNSYNHSTLNQNSYNVSESILANDDPAISVVASTNTTIKKTIFIVNPTEGDLFGNLSIPALDKFLPIYQGTSDDTLDKGVGHFAQSVMPGEEDNAVLSGHRDTVFTKLGDLQIGDLLIVETAAGIFTYEVKKTRIVDKDDKTVIVPTDHAVLTLTTCYPFYFVGKAPERYIVTADLIAKE